MIGLTVEAEDGETVIFGHTVSDLQTDVAVADGAITGTLAYTKTGQLKKDWGPGNFLALKFSDIDADATSVLVGLEPSEGSGLVEPIKTGYLRSQTRIHRNLLLCSGRANLISSRDLISAA